VHFSRLKTPTQRLYFPAFLPAKTGQKAFQRNRMISTQIHKISTTSWGFSKKTTTNSSFFLTLPFRGFKKLPDDEVAPSSEV